MDDRGLTEQLNNLILLNLALPLCSPEQSLAFLRLFYEKNNQRLKKKNHYTPVQVPYAKQDVITTRSQPTKQLTQGMHQHRNQHQQLTRSSNAQDQWMLRAITQPLSPVQKKKKSIQVVVVVIAKGIPPPRCQLSHLLWAPARSRAAGDGSLAVANTQLV